MEDVNTVFWKCKLLASSRVGRIESLLLVIGGSGLGRKLFEGSDQVIENGHVGISVLRSQTVR